MCDVIIPNEVVARGDDIGVADDAVVARHVGRVWYHEAHARPRVEGVLADGVHPHAGLQERA